MKGYRLSYVVKTKKEAYDLMKEIAEYWKDDLIDFEIEQMNEIVS